MIVFLQVVPGKVRCFEQGEAGAEIGLVEQLLTSQFSSIFPILGSKETSEYGIRFMFSSS